MGKKIKPKNASINEKSVMKLMRISPINHEFLASLCSKGMSFNDALSLVLEKTAIKPNFEKRELLV